MASPGMEELMRIFHSVLGQEKLRDILQEYGKGKPVIDMFEILWNIEESHRCLKPIVVEPKKCAEKSTRAMKLADDFLTNNNRTKALEYYSESIRMAPNHPVKVVKDEEKGGTWKLGKKKKKSVVVDYPLLAHSYAKRSAVLYDLQLYDMCLTDIAHAHGCKDLQEELEQRKKKCLEMKANPNYQNKESLLTKSPDIPKLDQCNPSIPAFSKACKLEYNEEKGRHIVAQEDISPGDILLVEKAYCFTLYKNNMSTYCSNCMKECVAPLPCANCTTVVYCSVFCREEAFNGSHWLECPILPITNPAGLDFTNVYKLLGRTTCTDWRQILTIMEERDEKLPPQERGINEEGIYSSEDFETIFNFCSNTSIRQCGDLYVKCLVAFVLTKLLQSTKRFFVDYSGNYEAPSEDDLLFTGGLLFSNLLKISCNGFNIYDYEVSGPPYIMKKKDIASAIFPALSLLNHACNANTTAYYYGQHCVLRASKALKSGDEITINYCKGSYLQSLEDRQSYLLGIYQFQCSCRACKGDWPLYGMLSSTVRIRCLICLYPIREDSEKCRNCNFDFSKEPDGEKEEKFINKWKAMIKDVKVARENIKGLAKTMKAGHPIKDTHLNIICCTLKFLEKHVVPPSPLHWDVRDMLETYFQIEQYKTTRIT